MTAAIAFPRNTASTFLMHLFGTGLADERYVVERFKALACGDTLIALTGGKEVRDAGAVIARLDKVWAKYDDMVLLHGGDPGVERIAAQWADRNAVHQVVCKPDWDRHGRAAPFRRNDELLELLPKGVLAFPGSGITGNLVDKAVKLGILVQRCPA